MVDGLGFGVVAVGMVRDVVVERSWQCSIRVRCWDECLEGRATHVEEPCATWAE